MLAAPCATIAPSWIVNVSAGPPIFQSVKSAVEEAGEAGFRFRLDQGGQQQHGQHGAREDHAG
jgi:hypothetical protein